METDVSGMGLGASILQTMNGMQFPWNKVPDKSALWPIAFTSKSLASVAPTA